MRLLAAVAVREGVAATPTSSFFDALGFDDDESRFLQELHAAQQQEQAQETVRAAQAQQEPAF